MTEKYIIHNCVQDKPLIEQSFIWVKINMQVQLGTKSVRRVYFWLFKKKVEVFFKKKEYRQQFTLDNSAKQLDFEEIM